MFKSALISSVALVPFLATGSIAAAPSDKPAQPVSGESSIELTAQPRFQTQCKLLAEAIAQNPAVEEDKIVGRVYSVVGSTVMIEKEDGSVAHVQISLPERGYLGQILGRKVVVRNVFCSRITLAPPPPPVITPIVVPPLQFSETRPVLPPVQPRPVPAPTQTPAPAPQVIPQTW
jgi:hypothetical protein